MPRPFHPIVVGDVWVGRGTSGHPRGCPVLVVGIGPWSVTFRNLDPHARRGHGDRTVRREMFLANFMPRPPGWRRRAR